MLLVSLSLIFVFTPLLTQLVVEQCHQKIPLGLLEDPVTDPTFRVPSHPFPHQSFLDNRHICRCWKEFDSLGEEQVLVLLPPEHIPLSNVQTCSRIHLVLSKIHLD
jgi:hypothetical protein